jgi:hypothetical protein
MAAEEESSNGWGGSREGAGRPLGIATERVVFYLEAAHKKVLDRYAEEHELKTQSEALRHIFDNHDFSA